MGTPSRAIFARLLLKFISLWVLLPRYAHPGRPRSQAVLPSDHLRSGNALQPSLIACSMCKYSCRQRNFSISRSKSTNRSSSSGTSHRILREGVPAISRVSQPSNLRRIRDITPELPPAPARIGNHFAAARKDPHSLTTANHTPFGTEDNDRGPIIPHSSLRLVDLTISHQDTPES
jgi:hypothetical protein